MSLITPRTDFVRTVRHISRLQEPNRDALVQYARFIGDTADYVLNQLIDTTLLKDRDFITWRAEQPPQPATAAAERQVVAAADPLGERPCQERRSLGAEARKQSRAQERKKPAKAQG